MMDNPLSDYLTALKETPARPERPFTSLSFAQSVDGSIAHQPGRPYRISGEASMTLTHKFRAMNDAILVGIGTVLADDPQLNVRHVAGDDPQPIILDSTLRIPLDSKVIQGPRPPLIATRESSIGEKAIALQAQGVRLLTYPTANAAIPLDLLLSDLIEEGVSTLMVEGGSQVITSFLTGAHVDWLMITIGPLILDGLPALGRHESPALRQPYRVREPGWAQFDNDFVLWGQPQLVTA